MSELDILEVTRRFLWAGTWICAPFMIAALVIGVVIGLFQALTSVQEATLTFAPKLLGLLLVFWMTSGFAARILISLFEDVALPMVAAGV